MERDCPLTLIEYIPDLLGQAHGFSCLLFGTDGLPVERCGATWLYTTVLGDNGWESWVRPFDLSTLQAGTPQRVLQPDADEDSAVLQHVLAVADDFHVGIYNDGLGIAAATASAPQHPFVRDPGFLQRPQPGWETLGGEIAGWSLEANGNHVLIDETSDTLAFWQGYDSYRASDFSGDLGWLRIQVDKNNRTVQAGERHAGNPLPFRRPEWSCARCGGQLASNVRVRGKRAYFYFMRPSMTQALIGVSLSDDPLFLEGVEHHVLGTTLGE